MVAGRRALPHEAPSWVDPAKSVWFVTICCRNRTANQLAINPTANHLLDSVGFRHDNHHWYAHIFLLMPDRCHALLSFPLTGKSAKPSASGNAGRPLSSVSVGRRTSLIIASGRKRVFRGNTDTLWRTPAGRSSFLKLTIGHMSGFRKHKRDA